VSRTNARYGYHLSEGDKRSLLTGLFMLSLAWMRYAWVHARARQKWADQTDDFNPLERDFRNKRMRLFDLMHPLTKRIDNKRIYDCELLGPANLFLYRNFKMDGITFFDCTAVVLWPEADGRVHTGDAVILENGEMHGGAIFNTTILIPPHMVKDFKGTGIPFATLTGDPDIDSPRIQGTEAETPQ
jgi:hypothetical protein